MVDGIACRQLGAVMTRLVLRFSRGLMIWMFAALLVTAFAGWTTPVRADDDHGEHEEHEEREHSHYGNVDALLGKIRKAYPKANLLKVERVSEEGNAHLLRFYQVKLLLPNGRILKLIYDVRTLALVETIGCPKACGRRQGNHHRRHRYRHRRRGGWDD